MDTLNDLLAVSDLISFHCDLTNETIQIINDECLQHIKPGAFLVNTGSSQLLDDCALKQLLIDGTLAGCALDGVEGPQWMEAWLKEMPNVLILPRSADYSEEAWMEIREKAISMLQTFFCDGFIPKDAVSDEDEEESEIVDEKGQFSIQEKESALQGCGEQLIDDIQQSPESSRKKDTNQSKDYPNQNQHIDTMSNVTKRDPAAQFLVVYRNMDTVGLRSFAAGGKLLQINRRMEFVFASHSFDVWESWTVQGPLEECRLVNCRNPSAVLDVRIEILVAVGEDDGITRWLD
ncbi:C-terminal binding protein AN-like [Hibiscus syriacus]|uniref:C-terminal binding protein AN-like n=1 Tax=Hibiscus syriacus TaxID=106335 RepID=UPI00192174E6|nr:C-terminal binding protein AN-like [Hibiscus syriacus]